MLKINITQPQLWNWRVFKFNTYSYMDPVFSDWSWCCKLPFGYIGWRLKGSALQYKKFASYGYKLSQASQSWEEQPTNE